MKHASRWILSVLSLCLAASLASAQTGSAPLGTQVQPVPQLPVLPAAAQLAPPADKPAAPEVLADPLAAAPPPEPMMPEWGNYTAPQQVPFAPPPLSYDLVGPPSGVLQPDVPQMFSQVLGDPASLPVTDEGLTQAINLYRPDGLAPIGVRGDHTLKAGRALLSARYDQAVFENLFVGSQQVSAPSVLARFPFAPAHLFQAQPRALFEYGVTDDLTLMLQLPWQRSVLDYTEAGGGSFTTRFTNPADITITGLYVLYRAPGQQLHLNLGMSFPVGFLDYLNIVPSPTAPNLPYDIRTSSGSYDLLPGFTYRGQNELWTWGAQATGDIHTGLNRLGYELGDSVDVTTWLSRRWTQRIGTSVRLDYQAWGNIRGADPRLNTALSPTNDPNSQGGTRLNILFGINYYLPAMRIPGQYISVEAGAPVFQSLDGPQLGQNWVIIAGWNIIF